MTDPVEVKLGADTKDLDQGMKSAADSVKKSLDDIQKSLDQLNAKHGDAAAHSKTHNEGIMRSFAEMKEGIAGSIEGVAGSFEMLFSVLGKLSVMVAGGLIGKEAIDEMLKFEESVRKLEITFGMTAEKAVETNTALAMAGISADTYQQMATKVGRVLKTNSDEFDRLKVVVKDSTDAFLPMDEILANIYKRMQDFKAGTDQDLFAMSTVGRGAASFASDMERLSRTQERAAQVMKDFGIEMSPERQAQIEEYRIQMNTFKLVIEEISVKLGEALLPGLMNLADYLNNNGPAAIHAMEEAFSGFVLVAGTVTGAIKEIIKTLALINGSKGDLDIIKTVVETIGTIVIMVARIIKTVVEEMAFFLKDMGAHVALLALKLNPFADHSAVVEGIKAREELIKNHVDTIERYAQEEKAALDKLWGRVAETPEKVEDGKKPTLPGHGKESFTPKPSGGGGDLRLAAWRDELLKMQEAQGYFNEFSKTQEAEFWAAKLALVKGNGKEDVALRQQLNHLIFSDRKAAANQELQDDLAKWQSMSTAAKNDKETQIGIAEARTATMKAIYGADSKEYQKALDDELKVREQWVQKEAAIMKVRTSMLEAAAKHEIEMDKLALDQGVALRQISNEQKFDAEMAMEDRLYQLQLKALQDELALLDERTIAYVQVQQKIEALEQSHQTKMTQISNSAELDRKSFITNSEAAMQTGMASFLSNLTSGTMTWKQAMLSALNQITQAISKLAADKIAQQIFGGGTSGNDMIGGLFSMFAGAFGGGVGLTGAMVPATGAMTAAGDFGLGAIASFDVGTPYVPQTGLALIHQGERIIPASQNNGSNPGAMAVTNHFNIQGPVDAATQSQIAAKAAQATQRAMRRNG